MELPWRKKVCRNWFQLICSKALISSKKPLRTIVMSNDLKDLEKKIHEARHGKDPSEKEKRRIRDEKNHRMAAQVGTEFVLSIVAGAFIGYWLDQWLGTTPLRSEEHTS